MAQTIFCDVAECEVPADVILTMTNGTSTDAFCAGHYELWISSLADVFREAREAADQAAEAVAAEQAAPGLAQAEADAAAAQLTTEGAAEPTEAAEAAEVAASEGVDDVPGTERPAGEPVASKRGARAAGVGR